MPIIFVIFLGLLGCCHDFIYEKLSLYALNKSAESIAVTVASHRAICATLKTGCTIDVESICYFSAYPGVSCYWRGGIDAHKVIRFYPDLGGRGSMGYFDLRIGRNHARIIVSFFASSRLRWYSS